MASGSILEADAGKLLCTHFSYDAMEEPYSLPVGDIYNSGVDHLSNNAYTLSRTKENSSNMK